MAILLNFVSDVVVFIAMATREIPTTFQNLFWISGLPSLQRNLAEKRALVTGITEQDGSYLAELLLEKGYEVRPFASFATCLN